MIGRRVRGPGSAMAVAAIALLACGGSARADEMPSRKPGLWQISMSRGDKQPAMVSKQCVDEKTDKRMQEMGSEFEKDCTVREAKRSSDRFTVHSVCKMDGKRTATTDAVFTGDFRESYTAEIDVRYEPPLEKLETAKIRMDAKRLGDCGDMKPGEIEMPGGMRFDAAALGGGDPKKAVEAARAARAARGKKPSAP